MIEIRLEIKEDKDGMIDISVLSTSLVSRAELLGFLELAKDNILREGRTTEGGRSCPSLSLN